MPPEERFERIEQTLAEMAESQKCYQKRHEEAQISHESWLLDHERWMQDQEGIVERHDQWQAEMEAVLTALAAQQNVTSLKLQAFIDSLRRGGNGHKKEGA